MSSTGNLDQVAPSVRAWAEQIAAIGDGLLISRDVLERIAGLQKGIRSPGFAFS